MPTSRPGYRHAITTTLDAARRIVSWLLCPVLREPVLTTSVLFLLVLPALLNAYWVNADNYHIVWQMGVLPLSTGAYFPYLLFLPALMVYACSAVVVALHAASPLAARLAKTVIYVVVIGLFAVNLYLLLGFQTLLSPFIFTLLAETNGGEVASFLSEYVLTAAFWLTVAATLLTAVLIVKAERSLRPGACTRPHSWVVLLPLLVVTAYLLSHSVRPLQKLTQLPRCQTMDELEAWSYDLKPKLNMVTNLLLAWRFSAVSEAEIRTSVEKTLAAGSRPHKQYTFQGDSLCCITAASGAGDDSLQVILVIGESHSRHHSNLYGYWLFTEPSLLHQQDSGRLTAFTDVIAPFNLTSNVMKNLFSTNSIMDGEPWYSEPTFPVFFHRAGYRVAFWDNQKVADTDASDFSIFSYIYDPRIAAISYDEVNKTSFTYDGELLDDYFSTHPRPGTKQLTMFHLMGQHMDAALRVPPDFMPIERADMEMYETYKRLTREESRQVAEYDNATRYVDAQLNRIMCHYASSDAVLIYLSDHGEEVNDYRPFVGRTHGERKTREALRYQYEVPFFIWYSDTFAARRPDVVERIAAAADRPFMTDNTCQLLFGLTGVGDEAYRPSRDVLSKQFRPAKTRLVEGNEPYAR